MQLFCWLSPSIQLVFRQLPICNLPPCWAMAPGLFRQCICREISLGGEEGLCKEYRFALFGHRTVITCGAATNRPPMGLACFLNPSTVYCCLEWRFPVVVGFSSTDSSATLPLGCLNMPSEIIFIDSTPSKQRDGATSTTIVASPLPEWFPLMDGLNQQMN